MSKAQLVILDEPTAALGVAQTRMVLEPDQAPVAQGVAVLVVSHNLNDVFAVADRLAILYLGQHGGAWSGLGLRPRRSVVDYMTTGRLVPRSGRAAARRARAGDRQWTIRISGAVIELPSRIESLRSRLSGGGRDRDTENDLDSNAAPEVLASSLGRVHERSGGGGRERRERRPADRRRPGGDPHLLPARALRLRLGVNLGNLLSQRRLRRSRRGRDLRAGPVRDRPVRRARLGVAADSRSPSSSPPRCRLPVVAGDPRRARRRARSIGFIHGAIITRLHVPSFVVTLGAYLILEGAMIEFANVDPTAVGGGCST